MLIINPGPTVNVIVVTVNVIDANQQSKRCSMVTYERQSRASPWGM
jgi:hypothetical protein